MATATILRRLMKEHKQMVEKPCREFVAYPLEDNMLEWHFTLSGPTLDNHTRYRDGLYHGRVLVPPTYPFAPPDVVLITMNGRFEVEKRICLSISSYHPENWQSTWGIATVLHSLREFMLQPGNNGIGAIDYPADKCRELAQASRGFKCPDCQQAVIQHWNETMSKCLPTTAQDKVTAVPQTPPMAPATSAAKQQQPSPLLAPANASPATAASGGDNDGVSTPSAAALPPTCSLPPSVVDDVAATTKPVNEPRASPADDTVAPPPALGNLKGNSRSVSSASSAPPPPPAAPKAKTATPPAMPTNNSGNDDDADQVVERPPPLAKAPQAADQPALDGPKPEPTPIVGDAGAQQRQQQQPPPMAAANPPPPPRQQPALRPQQQGPALRIQPGRNGLDIELSVDFLDRILMFLGFVICLVIFKKLMFDVPREDGWEGMLARRIYDIVVNVIARLTKPKADPNNWDD